MMIALTIHSLPGDDDGDDDDDTGAISTCAVEATHDVVAEICRKQVIWQCYHVSSIFWNLILYTFISWCCSLKFFQQLSLYANGQQTYFICR